MSLHHHRIIITDKYLPERLLNYPLKCSIYSIFLYFFLQLRNEKPFHANFLSFTNLQ